MDTKGEISIDMTADELATMRDEPDVDGLSLSPAAVVALESAAPNPVGGRWVQCSMDVARELLTWAEAGEARWRSINPAKAALFRAATKQVRFGLWKVGAGPAP